MKPKKSIFNFGLHSRLELDLAEITEEAADLVMKYPYNHYQFTESVKKISRFICVEMYTKLEKENMECADLDENDRNSFLEDTESDSF